MLRESGHRKPRPLPASLRPGGGLEPCRTAKDPRPPAAHPPGWVTSLSVSITANAPHETARWAWHLYPQPHPHRVEISTRFFTRRAPFLTPRSKRLRQGFSAVFVHRRALQSTHRRMSFLPPQLQAAAPQTMPSLYFHLSPGISESPERWNKQELPFSLYFGENEAQRSKMTSADTSGNSNHLQTAWLTVLHSSHTLSGSQNLLF